MKVTPKRCTVKGKLVPDRPGAPTDETLPDGQHADHFVMCPEERARGFVEPVRLRYRHVGRPGPRFPLIDLTDAQRALYAEEGYAKYEPYPESERPACGRFWTQEALDGVGKGCGVVTSMPTSIAETYASQPVYYGSTFCCGCGKYLPVGRDGEFVWEGTDQRVGTRSAKVQAPDLSGPE